MDRSARIRPLVPADAPAVVALGRALSGWFTEKGVANLAVDLANNHGAVAERGDAIVGFVTWYTYQGVAQLSWMGVAPDRHRQGIGRALLAAMEDHLRASGAAVVRVETLGDSVEYEPYARTRAFYRAMGFSDWKVETLDDPECPERLTLEKRLA